MAARTEKKKRGGQEDFQGDKRVQADQFEGCQHVQLALSRQRQLPGRRIADEYQHQHTQTRGQRGRRISRLIWRSMIKGALFLFGPVDIVHEASPFWLFLPACSIIARQLQATAFFRAGTKYMLNLSDGVKKALILIPTQLLPANARVASRREHLAQLELAKAHRANFLIIGHPKSGNTWLKVMISRLYQMRFDLPESKLINTDEFARKIPEIPRLAATNAYYSYEGEVG